MGSCFSAKSRELLDGRNDGARWRQGFSSPFSHVRACTWLSGAWPVLFRFLFFARRPNRPTAGIHTHHDEKKNPNKRKSKKKKKKKGGPTPPKKKKKKKKKS